MFSSEFYWLYVLKVTSEWQNGLATIQPTVTFQVSAVQEVIKSDLLLPETFMNFIHMQI